MMRLENILSTLARRHAPELLAQVGQQPDSRTRLHDLADGLARVGVLVLVGQLPEALQAQREAQVNAWIGAYGDLHRLLVTRLFPSFVGIRATYADDRLPPVVVIESECAPPATVIAGYVVPYLALRQREREINTQELSGVMRAMLDDLEAGDLTHSAYESLLQEGIDILKRMRRLGIGAVALTRFRRELFPGGPPAPPVPEAPRRGTTGPLFDTEVPVFFRPTGSATGSSGDGATPRRRPPIPDLPPRSGTE